MVRNGVGGKLIMTKKVFSLVPWTLGLVILALPVAAQESSSLGSIFQGLYDAIAVWFGDLDEAGLAPHIPPGGLTSAESPQSAPPASLPGAAQFPGNQANQGIPPGANATSGEQSEAAPYTMPGG